LPHIEDTTDGTWRRIRVLEWKSKFYPYDHDDYEPENPLHFVRDGDLIEKMEDWKQPFMWLLINKYWIEYAKNGLQEPSEVTKYTNRYKQNSDVFMEFIDKYIITTNADSDKEKQDYVYETFANWYKTAYPKKPIPASKDLIGYFIKKNFKVDKYNIKGIEVSNCKEDNDD
jgi:phage/plasmid-associated DNA primase